MRRQAFFILYHDARGEGQMLVQAFDEIEALALAIGELGYTPSMMAVASEITEQATANSAKEWN